MPKARNGGSTSPPGETPFPAIFEAVIGAGLVQTTDARELHASLSVGRDFTTWIEARIKRYGFTENVDYVVVDGLSSPVSGSAKARPQATKEYHLTLDMAKELAMVENNERGRATRRYFIAAEKLAHETGSIDLKEIGGVVKGILAKQLREIVPALVREQVLSGRYAVVPGISAGQVLEMAGVEKRKGLRGLARWISSRLCHFHAAKGAAVRLARLGSRTAYVFDELICREWLATGGKAEIEQKIAERRGQGVFRLVPPTNPPGEPA